MEADKIFKVKLYGIVAELEFNKQSLVCLTGDRIHFDVLFTDIRAYEFQKPNNIALNFYKNFKLVFVKMSSSHAIDIVETIEKSV